MTSGMKSASVEGKSGTVGWTGMAAEGGLVFCGIGERAMRRGVAGIAVPQEWLAGAGEAPAAPAP